MIKNPVRSAIMPLALGSLMMAPGCNKVDEILSLSQTALLVGDWRITEFDGDIYPADDTYIFSFKVSGDWTMCDEGDCYTGNWRWASADENTIIISNIQDEDSGTEWRIDVVILDATRLEGTFDAYGPPVSIKFVKV